MLVGNRWRIKKKGEQWAEKESGRERGATCLQQRVVQQWSRRVVLAEGMLRTQRNPAQAQGNRLLFYFNSPLSKQFIELDLQNEHHRSYCNKEGNECIKLQIGSMRQRRKYLRLWRASLLSEMGHGSVSADVVMCRTCPHEVKMVNILSRSNHGEVTYHLQIWSTDDMCHTQQAL